MEAIPDLKVIIRADRRPVGEHARRFNAPATNEVAIILVGEEHGKRDIVLNHRDNRFNYRSLRRHTGHMTACNTL